MNLRRGMTLALLLLSAGACSITDPVKIMADARHKLSSGQRSQAVFELREFVRKRPAYGEVRVMLARLLLEQGDLAGAKQAIAGLGSGAAATADATLLRLQIAAAEGRFKDVLTELEAHGAPLDPETRAVQEARALMALGRSGESVEHLERALSAHPDSVSVATELALERAALGDLASGVRALENLTARHRDAEALAALGSLELRAERAAPAARHLEDALAAAPADWAPMRRWTTELALGDAYLSLRDVTKSKAVLEALRKELPNSAGFRLLAARVALLDGRAQDAVTALQPMAQAPEASPRIALLYATALAAAGNREQALQTIGGIRTRIAGAPTAELWLALGAAETSVKDFAAASSAMDEGYRLAPSVRTAAADYQARTQAGVPGPEQPLLDWIGRTPGDSTAHTLLGEHYLKSGQSALAIEEFEVGVTSDRNNFVARNNLAGMISATDPDRAERLAREALELAPGVPAVEDTLGWILVQRAKAAEGLPLLTSAAGRLRGDESVQYHYAAALAQAGRGGEAKMILETIVLSTRDARLRSDATQLLERVRNPVAKREG